MFEEKRLNVKYGRLAYKFKAGTGCTVLFLHNNNISMQDWIKKKNSLFGKYTWIIPDFIGFGSSSRIEDKEAFSVIQYTEDLQQLLNFEKKENIIIIGDGMGGLIGHEFSKSNKVNKIIHIMTPLDTSDVLQQYSPLTFKKYDSEFQKKITLHMKQNTTISQRMVRYLRKQSSYSGWASNENLLKYLKNNEIDLDKVNYEFHYLIPQARKGQSQAERRVKQSNHRVTVISDSKSNIHIENPKALKKFLDEILSN